MGIQGPLDGLGLTYVRRTLPTVGRILKLLSEDMHVVGDWSNGDSQDRVKRTPMPEVYVDEDVKMAKQL